MRKLCAFASLLALASSAYAAPNVTNVTQKGSLLIWPDVRIDDEWNTLIRLQNDGNSNVDVICYWMDGNKNRVDFIIPVTRNQPVWFDARAGRGTYQVNPFPQVPSNGIDNPFLISPGATVENVPYATVPGTVGDDAPPFWKAPYLKGLLACWAIDGGAQNQVKWNHLSGTATIYHPGLGAYEYNAYAFFVQTGIDLAPVATAGTLNLNGVDYDSCPLYQIGQFTPSGFIEGVQSPDSFGPAALAHPLAFDGRRLAIAGCTLNLNQDFVPVFTKLVFDVFNEDEIKFTGAFECADSWHETSFAVDAALQNFTAATLNTFSARYRVQGIKSTQCERTATTSGGVVTAGAITTQAVGVLAVQSTFVTTGFTCTVGGLCTGSTYSTKLIGTTLASAGKMNGKIVWDPEGEVPEGSIR